MLFSFKDKPMKELTFTLTEEYIELIKLLKIMRLCESGGMAKLLVEEGMITCNGKTELRKRYKVKKGDVIRYDNYSITVL